MIDVTNNQKKIYTYNLKRILNNKNKTDTQKIKLVNELRVKFQSDIVDVLKEYTRSIALFGLKLASKELKMKNPKKLPSSMRGWVKAMSETIGEKYLSELNMLITMPVINVIDKNLSTNEVVYKSLLAFDEISDKKLREFLRIIEGQALYRGRDLAMRVYNGDIKLERINDDNTNFQTIEDILREERVVAAQWSAVLDNHVCELCASLDGKIIDIEDPDYAYYVPGEIHPNCRCLWVYIRSSEKPENRVVDWKAPSQKLLDAFAFKQHKDTKKRKITDEDIEDKI